VGANFPNKMETKSLHGPVENETKNNKRKLKSSLVGLLASPLHVRAHGH